jgi:hypothetical protein
MADLGNTPIRGDSTDEHLRLRASFLCAKFGGIANEWGYLAQLERRLCKLEQANMPAHLKNLEQR